MTTPSVDAHVRLDTHPTHPSAVTATLTGTQAHIAHVGLEAAGWHVAATNMLVLARIDHEEPYWAEQAARQFAALGITVEITPRLREAIDEGRLRQIAKGFATPAQALAAAFEDVHADTMRPGPAPVTDTERAAAETRTSPGTPTTAPELPSTGAGTAPADEPGPGAHEALLDSFIEDNGEWEKYRTWSDETSVANHETLTLRAEFDHEARGQDIAWTIASYQSPVGERTWHATATAGTPTDMIKTLLDGLDTDTVWTERTSAPLTERTLTTVTRPLTELGWTHTINGHHINWPAPNGKTGLRLDVAAAVGATTARTGPAWIFWGGTAEQPDWTVEFSRHTPAAVLHDLTYELATTHSVRPVHPSKTPRQQHEVLPTVALTAPSAVRSADRSPQR